MDNPTLTDLSAAVDAALVNFATFAAPVLEAARPVGEHFAVPAESMEIATELLGRWRTACAEYGAARARIDGRPMPPPPVPRLPRRTRAQEEAAGQASGEALAEHIAEVATDDGEHEVLITGTDKRVALRPMAAA